MNKLNNFYMLSENNNLYTLSNKILYFRNTNLVPRKSKHRITKILNHFIYPHYVMSSGFVVKDKSHRIKLFPIFEEENLFLK